MRKLIDSGAHDCWACVHHATGQCDTFCDFGDAFELREDVKRAPTVDAISKGLFDQIKWERDIAIGQLREIGCELGQKMDDVARVVRCKDCKYYQESAYPERSGLKFCYRLKHPTENRRIGYNYSDDDFCSYGERKEKDNV